VVAPATANPPSAFAPRYSFVHTRAPIEMLPQKITGIICFNEVISFPMIAGHISIIGRACTCTNPPPDMGFMQFASSSVEPPVLLPCYSNRAKKKLRHKKIGSKEY
jgi:hypothetical protein